MLALVLVFTGIQYGGLRLVRAATTYTFTNSNGDTVNAGATIDMRRATDALTINEYEAGDSYEWSSTNENVLKVVSGVNSRTANLQVQNNAGQVYINCIITHADNSQESVAVTINVVFSINEMLSSGRPLGVDMERLHAGDMRKVLIMDRGTKLYIGSSAVTEPAKLNLIFGSGIDENTNWRTSNPDVVDIPGGVAEPYVEAIGAGTATLTVEYNDGTNSYTDSMTVYVRPQITDADGNVIAGQTGDNTTKIVQVENGDKIGVTASYKNNPLENIEDKVTWVISKSEGESTVLVRDSLGHTGKDAADARLVWIDTEKLYRIEAKAGVYNIQFYVKGTYTDFDSVKEEVPACRPVSVQTRVLANYNDKNVTVNIGGSYDMSEAFNIPLDTLVDKFDFSYGDSSSNAYVTIDKATGRLISKAIGTAKIIVHPKSSDVDIPGISYHDVTITMNVVETFALNITNISIGIGATAELYGVIGSGAVSDSSRFTWTVSDANYVGLSDEVGNQIVITGKKKTESGKPIQVTCTWQDSEGVRHTATCNVTVLEAARMKMNPAATTLYIGGESKSLDTGLTGTQNVTWQSQDPDVVKVTPDSGNCKATITAGKTAGTVVVTAYNEVTKEQVYCTVTVINPIKTLTIDKGEKYDTTKEDESVVLIAKYTPSDALKFSNNLEWSIESGKEDIIHFEKMYDNNGDLIKDRIKVVYDKVGTVQVSVRPQYNPEGVSAHCVINIDSQPITKIVPDETELDMIAGDSIKMGVTLTPAKPADPTLLWTTSDSRIATVDNEGNITAVSAGQAIISISGGIVGGVYSSPVQIKVNVRNRLTNIEFLDKEKTISVNEQFQLGVIFTPATGINDKLFWQSSDEDVVQVTSDGIITGISEGDAMVSCYAEDLGVFKAITCLVHVTSAYVYADDLTILPESETLIVGETLIMNPVFTPATTTDKTITWSSSDEDVAIISAGGTVTAIAPGTTKITAIYMDTPDGQPWFRYSTITVKKADVDATDFDLDPDTINIKINEVFQLTPKFTPADTTDQSVVYQSSDESVISVSDTGVVKGVGEGDAIVQAQAEASGLIATCHVHVDKAIDFKLNPASRDLAVGSSIQIVKVTNPANADKTATWSSTNPSVAKVSSTGVVTGLKIGSCYINCHLTYYNQTATCKITVSKLKTKIKLDKTSIRMGLGQTYKLKKTVTTNAAKTPSVKWKSSNKKIATVTSSGKIKAKKVGSVKITCTAKDATKAKATCRVIVIRRVSSLRLDKVYATCFVGRSISLKAIIKPKNASIKKLTWTSSNNKVARVVGGRVTGMEEGTAIITVQTNDGSNRKAKCTVHVQEEIPVSSIMIAQKNLTMKRGDSAKLSFTALPKNTSDSLTFASDNKRVAKVSSTGVVKAVGTGNATITIMSTGGVTATVDVNVVALNKTSMKLRQYDTETLNVFGTSNSVTWYSSNNRIATVSGGKVTARGRGSCYIYAFVNGCKMACKITVVKV